MIKQFDSSLQRLKWKILTYNVRFDVDNLLQCIKIGLEGKNAEQKPKIDLKVIVEFMKIHNCSDHKHLVKLRHVFQYDI